MQGKTRYQALAELNRLVGERLTIRPGHDLVATKIEGDVVTALWSTAKVKQRARDEVVTHRGQTVMTWKLLGGRWLRQSDIAWSEPLPEPERTLLVGQPLTPAEHAARIEREQMAWRVGTDADPRDSHARQAQGYIQLLS